MSLEKAIQEWSNSKRGKDLLLDAKNKRVRAANSYDATFGNGDMSLEDIGYEVISRFDYYIREAGFEFGEYLEIVGAQTVQIGDEIVWEIQVDFDPHKVGRESWYPEKYPYGAYDIVQLMNNGYDADNYVYKDIEIEDGKKLRIRSLKTREGAYFMQRAEGASNAAGSSKGYWVEINPRFNPDGLGY